jgi:hypothetical protein
MSNPIQPPHDPFGSVDAATKALLHCNLPDVVPPTPCAICGALLSDEEDEDPAIRDGEIICDECEEEHYQFLCSWCENYDEKEIQHRYLVVFDHKDVGLPHNGLYQITRLPYYTAPLIGRGEMDARALTWLGSLPSCAEAPDGYPCGHLCTACQTRALDEIRYVSRCKIIANL